MKKERFQGRRKRHHLAQLRPLPRLASGQIGADEFERGRDFGAEDCASPALRRAPLPGSHSNMRTRNILLAIMFAAIPGMRATAEDSSPKPRCIAKAVIQFKAESGADPELLITANLPRGDSSAAVHAIRNTDLFEITVLATDAKQATKRVNQIALALQRLLSDPDGTQLAVRIWAKGELVQNDQ